MLAPPPVTTYVFFRGSKRSVPARRREGRPTSLSPRKMPSGDGGAFCADAGTAAAGISAASARMETRNSDRRGEAPGGGAVTTTEGRNSDRRCEAPQGGAVTTTEGRNS